MLKIDVRLEGVQQVMAMLNRRRDQIPFAIASALTKTAKAVMDEQQRLLPAELDRPKPSSVGAMAIETATKVNLQAAVKFKKRGEGVPAEEFLRHNISGGRRGMKRSEIMLRSAGILPEGLYTIPGKEAKLDAYGNMSRGQIVSILSFFRTFGATRLNSKRMNATDKSRARRAKNKTDYFFVPVADRRLRLHPGIWQRQGDNNLAPVLMFVRPGQHKKMIKFHETARRVVDRDFNRLFDQAFANAVGTAR